MNSKIFQKDQVAAIINSVIQRIEKTDAMVQDQVYGELLALRQIIDDLRAEMSATRPAEGLEHFPQAHDELDAVVDATEAATNNIMDACEIIQSVSANAPDGLQEQISAQVMRIFEACTFQDITGQRIGKVTKSLKEIEFKLQAVLAIFAEHMPLHDVDDVSAKPKAVVDTRPDADVMEGPQLAGHGISQDEIDRLLEDF